MNQLTPEQLVLVSDAIKILGPASIAALSALIVGYFGYKSHVRGKSEEGKYKTKELKFNYYRERIEKNAETLKCLTTGLGELAGVSMAESNHEEGGIGFTKNLAPLIIGYAKVAPLRFTRLTKELSGYGEKYKDVISALNVQSSMLEKICGAGDLEYTPDTLSPVISSLIVAYETYHLGLELVYEELAMKVIEA